MCGISIHRKCFAANKCQELYDENSRFREEHENCPELFVFETGKRKIDTRNKGKLKQTVHSLKKSKKSLIEENIILKEGIRNVGSRRIQISGPVDCIT